MTSSSKFLPNKCRLKVSHRVVGCITVDWWLVCITWDAVGFVSFLLGNLVRYQNSSLMLLVDSVSLRLLEKHQFWIPGEMYSICSSWKACTGDGLYCIFTV